MSNVVSAAVVSGELIIGLDDGSIVRCGYVQGPQGLKGDQGPMGATGPAGVDGNTLHTVEGIPDGSLGKDGDYCIDRIEWRISGPKAGGRWPQFVDMLAKGKGKKLGEKGSAGFGVTGGGGSSGGSGPGGDVFTNQVIASATGRLAEVPIIGSPRVLVQYPGSPNGIIPPSGTMGYQSNINAFIVDALDQLDMGIPVPTTDDPPTRDVYEGKLWFDSEEDELTLYIRYGGEWVPAAPPVSLDGIEASIANIDEELLTINANVAINKSEVDERLLDFQIAQDAQDIKIEALETSQGNQDERLDALEAQDQDDGKFLPTAGGELKGTLQINGSMDEKIDPLLCRADGYYMTFGVTKTGEVLAGSSPGLPFLAVDNWHVVTKGYLDSRLPDQGLFHETWWTFRAGADRSDCEKGEFCADSTDFFMSDKNEDNHSWGPSVSGGRSTQAFVTIYSSDGKLCHTYEVNKIYFHEKYTKKYITEFDWTWSHVSNALVDGAKYKIVVPGFLT